MLLHQRIDYNTSSLHYVSITMSSTLWTMIEKRSSHDTEPQWRSRLFPSRIIKPDRERSVVFTGVDTSELLRDNLDGEYRLLWRTVPDPDDIQQASKIILPLGSPVTLTYSYGSSTLLSLTLAGVDVTLNFDIESRILSTSWFTPPFTTSWTLEHPRRIMKAILTRIWQSPLLFLRSDSEEPPLIESSEHHTQEDDDSLSFIANRPTLALIEDSICSRIMSLCCPRTV